MYVYMCEQPHPQYHKKSDNVETNVADAHITSLHMFWSWVSKWSGVGGGGVRGGSDTQRRVPEDLGRCRARCGLMPRSLNQPGGVGRPSVSSSP